LRARSVIIATGAQYRELDLANLRSFTGAGVYYAATHLEAKLCRDEEIIIVGGGNSAGQAAVFLAGGCRHVHIMVRGAGLADSMSDYLIRRIRGSRNITLHAHTRLTDLEGSGRLERVKWRDPDGVQSRDIGHVFLMTGAAPNTGWLQNCVCLDDKGFVCTGSQLSAEDLREKRWPLARAPHMLETCVPGVFAVGDVRSGNVKRIASAVGEGAICVQMAHRVLAEVSP
jgi:thioredoxin reductase (NADPH)